MQTQPSYTEILDASARVNWRIEDVLCDRTLRFDRPFLPETLARVEPLDFLEPSERLTLNHVRGHGYLCMFGLVEEFILPFVLDHARTRLSGDDRRVRALLQFAAEEAKHIELFKRFRAEFERGFGHRCEVIGPPEAVAEKVLSHHPLAVALVVLHIEWMTQRHYVESVRDEGELDPLFRSLLRHHWLEEAQHAKLDLRMVEALAEACPEAERRSAFDEYLAIGAFLDAGLGQQVVLDLAALERAIGRELPPEQRARFLEVQRQAQRYTFLGSGMTHPTFLECVGGLAPGLRERLEEVAPAFCWEETVPASR